VNNDLNVTQKDPNKPPAETPQRPMTPVCPYCGIDPLRVMSSPFKLGALIVMSVYCGVCRKLLSMFPVGMDEPMVQPAQSDSRIVLPN